MADPSEPLPKKQKLTSDTSPPPKKRIFLNAFDTFTVGHMSFGQWRNPADKSSTKRRSLTYWTSLAQLLEKGDFNALFLADTFGWCDVYTGSAESCVRTGTQFPMGDPVIPISAMAARFSTLDHLTGGRFGWNVVTSWKASGFEAIGVKPTPHDERYAIADEYLRVLYQLWEGSWADDALLEDKENEIYADFSKIKTIHHEGKYFKIDASHILDPSPQRTPFLFQAGTSLAGIDFGATHAEGIFVVGLSPHMIAPRVKAIRAPVASKGRDPQSVKVFASMTPIIGRTHEEAEAKCQEVLKYASEEGGLVYWCANTGIDLRGDSDTKVQSLVANLAYKGDDVPKWTPRNIGKTVVLGASGPVPVGTAEDIADEMERWMEVADLDGVNIGHIVNPGTWEDVVELLVPELRRRGVYAPVGEGGTMRERIYGVGESRLRGDHVGSRYKYSDSK